MLSARLKSETSDAHKALEKKLNLFRRVQDLSSYVQILKNFFVFVSPVENQIAGRFPETGLDLGKRAKTPLLEKDLVALNAPLPRPLESKALPKVDTLPSVLGYLYVMEGSTLDGQIISNRFAQTLPLSPEQGLAFYFGYGKNTRAMCQRV